MAKDKSVAVGSPGSSWVSEMLHAGLYKRSQGKIARQATFGALAATLALGAWRLFEYMNATSQTGGIEILLTYWPLSLISEAGHDRILQVVEVLSPHYVVPLVLFSLGLWVSFRMVNIPRFADFLIAVEAEMNKVSWPSKDELIRSSIVVIFVIVTMSVLLYGYDALWAFLFSDSVLGILHSS